IIELWNVETGNEIRTLTGHNEQIYCVSFSSDGKTLASGSEDKTIKLWNVETGQEIRTLSGHNDRVTSVSFSSDGKTLATSSWDNTIKLWNGEYGWGLDGLMGRSCDWVRAYLHNPNSGVREEDRGLCDGIGGK
ncbi:MAG: WD40 repeat domain-containing protein, partial [Microcystis panniformis]